MALYTDYRPACIARENPVFSGALITTGNTSTNDRCAALVMDYPNRRRLKLLGRLQMHDIRDVHNPQLRQVVDTEYNGKVERLALIEVVAYDWNCAQHIKQRYTEQEFFALMAARGELD